LNSSNACHQEVQINPEPPLYIAERKREILQVHMELYMSYKDYNRQKETRHLSVLRKST
jgi:hypothetical protein